MPKPPFAPLRLATPDIEAERRKDGDVVLRSRVPLEPHEPHMVRHAAVWAERAPDRPFLSERSPDGSRRSVRWSEAWDTATAIATWLLEHGISAERPVMVLSGNSIEHALLTLGSMIAGVPIVPVSPAYSLMSQDFGKLRSIHDRITPAIVYAADGKLFGRALDALSLAEDAHVVVSQHPTKRRAEVTYDALTEHRDPGRVDEAMKTLSGDTIAKVLFTSGSTGTPKGVINTQRMLVSNQQAIAQCWPFLDERPPVLVDWLPWSHTFGGNHNMNLVIRHGGTLHIDGGKPRPGLLEETIRTLREISPTLYFNVPAGFEALLPHLERDSELRKSFFRELDLIFYAGASLSQDLWNRLEALSIRERDHRVPMTSAWGSTETAPLATSAHIPLEHAGNIGVPVPGVEIRMVPNGPKMELRVRGPGVTPGHYRAPEVTALAFDEEGFYRIGDAGKLVNPGDPNQGILFDGRVSEDFKLATGTWVRAGTLRLAVLEATAPALSDAVVTGHDRSFVGLLAWPNAPACARIADVPEDEPMTRLVRHEAIRTHIQEGVGTYNRQVGGSSARIARVLLMTDPPSIDANEITDKGYVNQRAALERRGDLVERLHDPDPDAEVILID